MNITATSATPTTVKAVTAANLTKVYRNGAAEIRALDDVSAEFPVGQFTAIMGPSGSGKSTFLHVLAGLDRPTTGSVHVGGVELTDLSDRDLTVLRRTRIGFVFQAFNLVPSLTARDNITLPLDLAGTRPDASWFDAVLTTVGLGHRLDHRPSQLSGGQQQRVAVARALLTRPAVVFADEPTGNLDSNASAEVLSFLRRSVREHDQTIVMVTHDPHAAAYADRVLFLADGQLVDDLTDEVTVPVILDRMRNLGA